MSSPAAAAVRSPSPRSKIASWPINLARFYSLHLKMTRETSAGRELALQTIHYNAGLFWQEIFSLTLCFRTRPLQNCERKNIFTPFRLAAKISICSRSTGRKTQTTRSACSLFAVRRRTQKILQRGGITLDRNIVAIQPQGYLEMITLEKHARMILTDSGGVQKEAFYLRVPCVTLREQTEWTETVA